MLDDVERELHGAWQASGWRAAGADTTTPQQAEELGAGAILMLVGLLWLTGEGDKFLRSRGA